MEAHFLFRGKDRARIRPDSDCVAAQAGVADAWGERRLVENAGRVVALVEAEAGAAEAVAKGVVCWRRVMGRTPDW